MVNGAPHISPEARAAVLAAVDELAYVPNPRRLLAGHPTHRHVALVVSEPGDRLFGDPYFAATVRGTGSGSRHPRSSCC